MPPRRNRGRKMAEERTGIYPGTFDPITNGHVDIICRAAKLFDRLIVAIAVNTGKQPIFDAAERKDLVRQEIELVGGDYASRVEVMEVDGLLIEFARSVGARFIVRGLRAVSDFDYEFQLASMNAKMAPEIETVCLMASDKHQFIASSLVKEIARLNGDVAPFVSPRISRSLMTKLASK